MQYLVREKAILRVIVIKVPKTMIPVVIKLYGVMAGLKNVRIQFDKRIAIAKHRIILLT